MLHGFTIVASMKKPEVIFVHSSLRRGGAEVLRQSIVGELAERGVRFRICLLGKPGDIGFELKRQGYQIDCLGISGSIADPLGILKLSRYLKQHQPLIVQSSQFVTNVKSVVAAKISKIPVVITEEHGLYQWKRWSHKILDRLIVSQATAAISCSVAVQKFACSMMRVSDGHVRVIHNCAGPEFMNLPVHNREATLRHLLRRNSSFCVGIVASLRHEKRHSDLLEVWKQLHHQRLIPEDSALLIIGDGPLRNSLDQQAASLPGVHFLGEHSSVSEIMSCLDLFVLPSNSEGFGIAIVEAMHSGVPVIASQVGGIPEVIRHGKNGYLFTPRSHSELSAAITKIWEHPNLGKKLASQAFQDAQRLFTPQRYVTQLLELYQELFRVNKTVPPASWKVAPPELRISSLLGASA